MSHGRWTIVLKQRRVADIVSVIGPYRTSDVFCSACTAAGGRNHHADQPGAVQVRESPRILETGRAGHLAGLTDSALRVLAGPAPPPGTVASTHCKV